mmetsp:Transcript_28395/g.91641  ORF Transcript_28395/g.91641 Transcript_28395/m.91641 type:complete len:583 (+) Transcript_28395:1220-2968(+)
MVGPQRRVGRIRLRDIGADLRELPPGVCGECGRPHTRPPFSVLRVQLLVCSFLNLQQRLDGHGERVQVGRLLGDGREHVGEGGGAASRLSACDGLGEGGRDAGVRFDRVKSVGQVHRGHLSGGCLLNVLQPIAHPSEHVVQRGCVHRRIRQHRQRHQPHERISLRRVAGHVPGRPGRVPGHVPRRGERGGRRRLDDGLGQRCGQRGDGRDALVVHVRVVLSRRRLGGLNGGLGLRTRPRNLCWNRRRAGRAAAAAGRRSARREPGHSLRRELDCPLQPRHLRPVLVPLLVLRRAVPLRPGVEHASARLGYTDERKQRRGGSGGHCAAGPLLGLGEHAAAPLLVRRDNLAAAACRAHVTHGAELGGGLVVKRRNGRSELGHHAALHLVALGAVVEAALGLRQHQRPLPLQRRRRHVRRQPPVRRPRCTSHGAAGRLQSARRLLQVLAGGAEAVGVGGVARGDAVRQGRTEVVQRARALEPQLVQRALGLGPVRVAPRQLELRVGAAEHVVDGRAETRAHRGDELSVPPQRAHSLLDRRLAQLQSPDTLTQSVHLADRAAEFLRLLVRVRCGYEEEQPLLQVHT